MKLVVLDPGFTNVHSHHFTVNRNIAEFFSLKGCQVEIYCSLGVSADIFRYFSGSARLVPFFSTPCYPDGVEDLSDLRFSLLAESFSLEAGRALDTLSLSPGDCVTMHTAYAFHYEGLALCLAAADLSAGFSLFLCSMFGSGAVTHPELSSNYIYDQIDFLRHRNAFSLLRKEATSSNIEVSLSVPSESFVGAFSSFWPGKHVSIHPAVNLARDRIEGVVPTQAGYPSRILMYLGGVKESKGISFALDAATAACQIYPQLEFYFHFNQSFPGASRFSSAFERLEDAANEHGNVKLILGDLTEERYAQVLSEVDTACLLYDPSEYHVKTSGVLWDALSSGVSHWIVSSSTWSLRELQRMGFDPMSVDYNDVQGFLDALKAVLDERERVPLQLDNQYIERITSYFPSWLYDRCTEIESGRDIGSVSVFKSDFRYPIARILVVRTEYGHFSPLSGPGGFVKFLREMGYEVVEKFVPIGKEMVPDDVLASVPELVGSLGSWTSSYQLNSLPLELDIVGGEEVYDIIHFLDGEHSGLIAALINLTVGLKGNPKLVATFHQPVDVLEEIILRTEYLEGFDCLHLLSPCQGTFFSANSADSNIALVPHGVSPEYFYPMLPSWLRDNSTEDSAGELLLLDGVDCIVLTVGNWLRDFETLIDTAKLMVDVPSISFVIVSRGLSLPQASPENLILLADGLSDESLHALYSRARVLFLPLKSGAANNAILEAMSHGLPIITSDLESTRYYTDGNATFVKNDPAECAKAVLADVDSYRPGVKRDQISFSLRERARQLEWKEIAGSMESEIYSKLLKYEESL